METPRWVKPGDQFKEIGRVFGTPVVVDRWSWIPLLPGLVWLLLSRLARRGGLPLPWGEALTRGALSTPLVVLSEWGHNFAHAGAAALVQRRMDYLRILGGTPLVVYNDVNDRLVTPRQHMVRALGGPIFNLLVAPLAWLVYRRQAPGSRGRAVAGNVLGTNLLIPALGLLPLPVLDGGPLLKWSLVARGRTIAEANRTVQRANAVGACASGVVTAAAVRRRSWLVALLGAQFAGLMLAYALGWLRE